MPTPTEVVDVLVDEFEPTRSVLLEDAVIEVLRQLGLSESAALDWVDERQMRAVNFHLLRLHAEQLPFDMSVRAPSRLIGKKRPRPDDSPQTTKIREGFSHIPSLVTALCSFDEVKFEYLCAALMLRVGAVDAYVSQAADDGGVDFYGRIPVLLGDASVPPGLVRTTLEVRPVLYLGQAKRFSEKAMIGRPELQKFAGQVSDCIRQYPLMTKPPSHRVPENYYRKGEVCMPFFITTAQFSGDAQDYAQSVNMIIADGRLIAELLVYWGFGTKSLSEVDADSVVDWVRDIKRASPFSPPSTY